MILNTIDLQNSEVVIKDETNNNILISLPKVVFENTNIYELIDNDAISAEYNCSSDDTITLCPVGVFSKACLTYSYQDIKNEVKNIPEVLSENELVMLQEVINNKYKMKNKIKIDPLLVKYKNSQFHISIVVSNFSNKTLKLPQLPITISNSNEIVANNLCDVKIIVPSNTIKYFNFAMHNVGNEGKIDGKLKISFE